MEIVNNIINGVLIPLLSAVLLGVAGWLGVKLKQRIDKSEENKTKLEVVTLCVSAVEQIYKNLHGDEKLQECISMVTDMLSTRGIEISPSEIRIMIEATLAEFNSAFDSGGDDKQPVQVSGFQPKDEELTE